MKRFLKPAKIAPSPSGQPHGILQSGVFKRLLIAGQLGVDSSGVAPPEFEAQVELALDNVLAVIAAAQLTVGDLTKLVAYVTIPGALSRFEAVRSRKLGAATPISTYIEIGGLGDPRWLVSIEGEAAQETDA